MDKWSLTFGWIGTLAFVFAIPLAIVANLLTPKVNRWLESLSGRRAHARHVALKRKLAQMDEWTDAEVLSKSLKCFYLMVMSMFAFFVSSIALFCFAGTYIAHLNGWKLGSSIVSLNEFRVGQWLAQSIGILSEVLVFVFFLRAQHYADLLVPRIRDNTKQTLTHEYFQLHQRLFPGDNSASPPSTKPVSAI